MKRFFMCLVPLMMNFAVSANVEIVSAPVEQLFIPKGFDSNDNVEMIVRGEFPNTCYTRNKYEVQVQADRINIMVTAILSSDGNNCEEIVVPYLENVTIGTLQPGKYSVTVNNQLQNEIYIAEASSSNIDDYLYAMVDYVELGFTAGLSGQVLLVGKTMNCLSLDRVEVISNGKDTLSILPIMKKEAIACKNRRIPFSIPLSFNIASFPAKNILLFTRTMDGKSVHALIER